MTLAVIETNETRKGFISLEISSDKRMIDVCVREAFETRVTGEAKVRVSVEAFIRLTDAMLEEIGCSIVQDKEA